MLSISKNVCCLRKKVQILTLTFGLSMNKKKENSLRNIKTVSRCYYSLFRAFIKMPDPVRCINKIILSRHRGVEHNL